MEPSGFVGSSGHDWFARFMCVYNMHGTNNLVRELLVPTSGVVTVCMYVVSVPFARSKYCGCYRGVEGYLGRGRYDV